MPAIVLTTHKSAMAGMNASDNFTSLREAGDSDFATLNTNSTQIIAVKLARSSGRGGTSFQFQRAYFAYDFTGYGTAAGTMSDLQWNFTGTSASSGDHTVRLVKNTAFGTGISVDYDSGNWWDSLDLTTPYNPSSGANATWADGTTDQVWDLDADARTDAQSDEFLKFTAMNYEFDFLDDAPTVNVADISYINNQLISGVTKAFISFSWTPTATGYENTVNAIIPANISKILGVPTLNISKVNGVL
tara:strand:- start:230 stop:967 length:738 start_codon:yes stop_codon:yes gene_type:complete